MNHLRWNNGIQYKLFHTHQSSLVTHLILLFLLTPLFLSLTFSHCLFSPRWTFSPPLRTYKGPWHLISCLRCTFPLCLCATLYSHTLLSLVSVCQHIMLRVRVCFSSCVCSLSFFTFHTLLLCVCVRACLCCARAATMSALSSRLILLPWRTVYYEMLVRCNTSLAWSALEKKAIYSFLMAVGNEF